MNEKLCDALNEISDRHIQEAARAKRLRTARWLSAVAAVLAAAILVSVFYKPVTAKAIALADYSQGDRSNYQTAREYTQSLSRFFGASTSQILSGSNEKNVAYSPINLYMGLAALAELTGGDPQILAALGQKDLPTLRKISSTLWNVSFRDKNNQCLLANSLWLDHDLSYNQAVMDTLAQEYYTSVYQGNFGTARTNRDIANWLNQQTGNLLKDSAKGIDLKADTVFVLYSTIYYQAKWASEFRAVDNTQGAFHAPQGDITCTYMHKEKITGFYYWGTDFGAVSLSLKDGSKMWLILPDEDKTVDEVLASDEYNRMIFGDWKNQKHMFINLSLPKFDVRSNADLQEDLKALGITDVFDPDKADFSTAMPTFDAQVWLTSVNQATRVAIDERGVTAASYIEFPGATKAEPPDDTVDFILDRPFLFAVTNFANVPLFAGVVNEP